MAGISFGGLLSGIDTESIVKAIVDARRFPVTRLETRIDDLLLRKDTLRTANSRLLELQKKALTLRLESTFLGKTTAISNPAVLSATAKPSALPGTSVLTVSQLARGAQARSGLGDRALDRGVAALIQGNSAGIGNVSLTSATLSGTAVRASDLLTQTLQAGRGAAKVTAGDTIHIQGTRKSGAAVDTLFTFAGDSTDSVQRLANTVQAAFGGDVQVSVGPSGQLILKEADLSVVGNYTLSALTFSDADLSGSTFDIGLGPAQASGGAQTNELTGARTFTTTDSATIATAATLLNDLDQLTGAPLDDGLDVVTINFVQPDGTVGSATYTYANGDTLQDLLDEINTAFAGDATATIVNGRIVVTDAVAGTSETALGLTFGDDASGNANSLSFGLFVETRTGASETAQVAHTTVFEVPARGRYDLTASDGKAGRIVGTVALQGTDLLGSFVGLTEFNRFTVDRDTGADGAEPLAVLGLNERSTVQDFVDALNTQVSSVTASLVDNGAGAFNLQVSANQGATELRVTDVAGGILDVLFDPTAGVDVDVTTANSTSATNDVTFLASFTRPGGGAAERVVISHDEGTAITSLIPNVSLSGFSGNQFSAGAAVLYTDESSELNLQPASAPVVFGALNIADPARITTPPLDIFRALDLAGFAATIEDSETNPADHIDGTFSINGIRITIPDIDTTVQEVLGLINASAAGVIASYDPTLDRIVLQGASAGQGAIILGQTGDTSNFLRVAGLLESAGGVSFVGNDKGFVLEDEILSASRFTLAPTSGTFTINGVTLTIDVGNDTLEDLLAKITNSAAGVTATYDDVNDRLVLTQKLDAQTIATAITVGSPSDTSNILSALRFTDTPSATTTVGTARTEAVFTVDGVEFTRNTNLISDVLTGVDFTLLAVSDDPVSLTIANDSERALTALAEFVVEYNTSLALLDPRPLSEDEREFLIPLTDAERATLTFSEIDAREVLRQELQQRDLFFHDTTVRRAITTLRRDLFDPVAGTASTLDRLSALGLTTAPDALGNETSFLVAESTDVEEMLQRLKDNPTLTAALRDDAQSVADLFAAPQVSSVEVRGSINVTFGVTLPARLSFAIGDRTNSGIVTLDAGTYTTAEIRNAIQDAINDAGLNGLLNLAIGAGGRLEFSRTQESGQAVITIQDLAAGASLLDTLGLASGTVAGPAASATAGIARRLETTLKTYTGLEGLLNSQVRAGGLLDRRLEELQVQLGREEELLAQFEARTRQQFVALETALARFQRDSQFLQARMQAISAQSQPQGF